MLLLPLYFNVTVLVIFWFWLPTQKRSARLHIFHFSDMIQVFITPEIQMDGRQGQILYCLYTSRKQFLFLLGGFLKVCVKVISTS